MLHAWLGLQGRILQEGLNLLPFGYEFERLEGFDDDGFTRNVFWSLDVGA